MRFDPLGKTDSEHDGERQQGDQEIKQQPEHQTLPFALQVVPHQRFTS
jgi:hypothetical protein